MIVRLGILEHFTAFGAGVTSIPVDVAVRECA